MDKNLIKDGIDRNLIINSVEEMITTEEEKTVTINNRKLDLEWWDDNKNEGVIANYWEEYSSNYSSTGVFFIGDKNWKEKFIEAIEFIVEYR